MGLKGGSTPKEVYRGEYLVQWGYFVECGFEIA